MSMFRLSKLGIFGVNVPLGTPHLQVTAWNLFTSLGLQEKLRYQN